MKNNKVTFIFIVILILSLIILGVYKGFWEYLIQRVIYSNNSTILYSCEEFSSSRKELENQIGNFEGNIKSDELIALQKYIKEKSFNISIEVTPVGNRCEGKYQFEILFGGDEERIEIEKILKDQKLNGIPVYLKNV